MNVDLHIQDAHTAYARLDFGPHMGMRLYIFLNHLRVVPQVECLAIAFHVLVVSS